jgi:SAM-dependent methyltransferase
MHRNSELMFLKHARSHFRPAMRVLEIGPDGAPTTYQRLVGESSIVWDTVDLADAPNRELLTFRAESEYRFPITDGAYDIVISGQVIEHVRKVWVWIGEVARVCKPGGRVITVNPVNWPYHEGPVDCWRIYPEGMRALYEEAGLDVEVAVFEGLDDGSGAPLPGPRQRLIWEAKQVARRILKRPHWPLGPFVGKFAVDGITIGRKPV